MKKCQKYIKNKKEKLYLDITVLQNLVIHKLQCKGENAGLIE